MYGRGHGTGEKSLTRRPRTAAQKAADVAASIVAHGLDVTDGQRMNLNSRYEVGNKTVGLYECFARLALAENGVRRLLQSCPDEPAWLFDRHAKVGAIHEWLYAVTISTSHDRKPCYQYATLSTKRKACPTGEVENGAL